MNERSVCAESMILCFGFCMIPLFFLIVGMMGVKVRIRMARSHGRSFGCGRLPFMGGQRRSKVC
ncbi:MAG TPA: hypothetical protein PKZ79_03145 [Ottowia sp.]|uniref:hypothetical protein n=1 Tax=Ottowia sp. TaxID=1898956 RepID=UPI0011D855DC|nr:hypothetical protein [Ottowia sp.]TXI18524.1 MAG: hypothetical protein E6Q65_05995 [Ottowia sp.]HNR84404.1 hypothetical protein [Ottowia sp.]HNT84678.1 hypothetical protein [Ottowia sp.]HOZ93557.1 hypothetical protein [Ottowia sp.]HQO52447.1 hypothetical protein [Ottowia sp.]